MNRSFESVRFKVSLIGKSGNNKTSHWEVICKKCNKSLITDTTTLPHQYTVCPCGEKEIINYNKLNT